MNSTSGRPHDQDSLSMSHCFAAHSQVLSSTARAAPSAPGKREAALTPILSQYLYRAGLSVTGTVSLSRS